MDASPMKKFKFSLQSVLDVRKRAEEEQRRAFAQRCRELQTARTALARFHESIGSESARAQYAQREYLDRCITIQYALISRHRTALERARTGLAAATGARTAIDKLRDKRLAEHRALEFSMEQKELEDAAGGGRGSCRPRTIFPATCFMLRVRGGG